MPLYEYHCPACDRTVEVLQRMDAPPPTCAHTLTSSVTMEKRVTFASFHLKGSGWYATDFKGAGG